MKLLLVLTLTALAPQSTPPIESHFECMELEPGRYRPYYLQALEGASDYIDWSEHPKGLLGQNAMTSMEECARAVETANGAFGVICSRTGLDGWKPTLYTGTDPGRTDFGYLGGSSIMVFEDCLEATSHSSELGVCFWGGWDWYVSPIDEKGLIMGPFDTIQGLPAGLSSQERRYLPPYGQTAKIPPPQHLEH
jgi:hypothetical protein